MVKNKDVVANASDWAAPLKGSVCTRFGADWHLQRARWLSVRREAVSIARAVLLTAGRKETQKPLTGARNELEKSLGSSNLRSSLFACLVFLSLRLHSSSLLIMQQLQI